MTAADYGALRALARTRQQRTGRATRIIFREGLRDGTHCRAGAFVLLDPRLMFFLVPFSPRHGHGRGQVPRRLEEMNLRAHGPDALVS